MSLPNKPVNKKNSNSLKKHDSNNHSQIIYIKITPTKPVLPLMPDDFNEQQEKEVLANCPKIDLRTVKNKESITEFLIELFSYYYDIPKNFIHPQSDIVNDIERYVWARELGVSFEGVTYGRVFCSEDDNGNAIGGIEDRGMMIAMLYMTDFSKLVGIELVDNEEQATFCAEEHEFTSYYECDTISDLSDLIYSVRLRLINSN